MNIVCGGQGTFNCVILVSRIGGSGDPRRKWGEMGKRERERTRERERKRKEKCCFCLQNDLEELYKLQEVYILPLKKLGLRHLSRLSKSRTYALRGNNSE